jgi:hypothetical protein
MINEGLLGKDLEGSHHSLIEELSWYLLGVTEGKHDEQIRTKSILNVNAMPVRPLRTGNHTFLSFSYLWIPI